jgi:thiol-disulfide isomerase/thioredoxin
MKKKRKSKVKGIFLTLLVVGLFSAITLASGVIKVNVVNSDNSNVPPANFFGTSEVLTYSSIQERSPKSLILFSSNWCGSCEKISVDLQKYSENNPDIAVYVLDIEQNRDLASELGAAITPTIILLDSEKTQIISEIRLEQLSNILEDFRLIGVR